MAARSQAATWVRPYNVRHLRAICHPNRRRNRTKRWVRLLNNFGV